jgi:hypothetical protein
MKNELEKIVEGSGGGIITYSFCWRYQENPRKISVTRIDATPGNQTRHSRIQGRSVTASDNLPISPEE